MRLWLFLMGLALCACSSAPDAGTEEALAKVWQAACPLPSKDPLEQKWYQFTVLGSQMVVNPPGCTTTRPLNGYWAPGWAPPALKDGLGTRCDWVQTGGWRIHSDCGTVNENVRGSFTCGPPGATGGTSYWYVDTYLIVPVTPGSNQWIGSVRRSEKRTVSSPTCVQIWNVLGTFVNKPAGWPQ